MKSAIKFSAVTIVGGLLTACGTSSKNDSGSTDAISGLYAVTSQTKNSENCDQEGAADPAAPVFYRIFSNSEIFPGAMGWSSESCATVEACKDDSIDLSDLVFESQTGSIWTGESMTTATGGVNCSVSITTSNASKQADNSLAIESKRFSGILELTGDDCDPDSAKIQEQRASLTCNSLTKIITSAPQ